MGNPIKVCLTIPTEILLKTFRHYKSSLSSSKKLIISPTHEKLSPQTSVNFPSSKSFIFRNIRREKVLPLFSRGSFVIRNRHHRENITQTSTESKFYNNISSFFSHLLRLIFSRRHGEFFVASSSSNLRA
jgi:hypothetical protein